VIIEGRAPIWRYGMAMHKLHPSPAAAIAFYDPRLGAVVVATHSHAVAGGPGGGCDSGDGKVGVMPLDLRASHHFDRAHLENTNLF